MIDIPLKQWILCETGERFFDYAVLGDISYIPTIVTRSSSVWKLPVWQRDVVWRLQRQLATARQVLHQCPSDNYLIRFISLRRLQVRLLRQHRSIFSELDVCQPRRRRPRLVQSHSLVERHCKNFCVQLVGTILKNKAFLWRHKY